MLYVIYHLLGFISRLLFCDNKNYRHGIRLSSWNGMRTVRFAVGAFISLIFQVGMTQQRTNGEYCHSWKDAQSNWRGGFHCPERHDQREAAICCGKCELRYCCALKGARLDQGNCNNHEQVLQPGTSDDEKDAKSAVPVYVPFVIVGSVFLAFIFLGSMVAMGVCLSRKQEIYQSPDDAAGPQGGSGEQQQEAVPMTVSTGTSCGSTSSLYPPNASQACPTGPTRVHQTLKRQETPTSPQPSMVQPFTMHPSMVFSSLVHPSMLHHSIMHPYMAQMPTLYTSQGESRRLPSPCPPSSYTSTTPRHTEVII
ncbi:protein shisa-3-like isoform X1 [Salvelinus fontinalis]|uniref:protein shisa-3-like isoform X1 n=2 Tax=Salvelinus fontinalis TaxID=8038 RepID=UPI002485B81A|nr:protein shisa-3-like isoform X1 [Salvelinus fontinalis]